MTISMLKKYILPWLFFISFIAVLYVLIEKPYLPRVKNTNIFSEIYLQEKDGILAELGTSKYGAVLYGTRDGDGIHHTYKYSLNYPKTSEINVTITKATKDIDGFEYRGLVSVTMVFPLDEGEVHVNFDYDISQQSLNRRIFYTLDGELKFISEIAIDNGGLFNEYTNLGTEILLNKILTDWCSVYDSDYSPDDWGDLTVEDWVIED